MRPTLYVMVKEPRPGRVKTRLARGVGTTPAAWWFRHQTARLLRRLSDPRWHLVLAVSPDREGLSSRVWPGHLPRVAQGSGDLGARMARLLNRGGRVLVIGGDIPGITRAHIAEAIAALGQAEAVFGPAEDGGYWLIGWAGRKALPQGALCDVRWSGPNALSDSCRSLGPLRIAEISLLADIDQPEDLPPGAIAARLRRG